MPPKLAQGLEPTGLEQVLWIGGSACAGKTQITERLAATSGWVTYHCDEHFAAHRERADPKHHPGFCRLMDLSAEELWMRPVEQQVADLQHFYEDELEMILTDLTDLATVEPMLIEGAGLLPAAVAAHRTRPHQALWLVATPEFRRRHYPLRGPWVRELLAECSDPDRAYHHWMERDDRFARWITEQAERVGGRVIVVDDTRTLESTTAEVARCLRLDLSNHPSRATS